ncbi:MAG: alpha/beta fold hydrolase [Lachnospiraceae bacterium]|nr:alpha/beta fold hydrolase [Lachnospiraceae bacterium]
MGRSKRPVQALCVVLVLCAACALCAAGCSREKELQNTPAEGTPKPAASGEEPGDQGLQAGNQSTGSPTGTVEEPGGANSDAPTETADGPGDQNSNGPVLSGTAAEISGYYRELTLKYAQEMLAGNFSVCDAFSEELAGALSSRTMKSAWKQVVQGLGEPLSDAGERTEFPEEAAILAEASFPEPPASDDESGSIADFGGYVLTSAQIPYEKKNVILSITYGTSGAIEGIYLTYTLPESKPEQTERYTEYEVSVGDGAHPLDGLLTLPNGVEKPPVVLLVHGSGQSDKDEMIGAAGNAPFADIAHGLAEQGIATLRYNKRYYQYPELVTDDVTIRDEVLDDAAAAIGLLADLEAVDGNRIYVLGHSLGGMLAPCIVQENPQAAGLISMAGSPRGLWEIVYDQNITAMEAAQLGEAEREALAELVRQEYDRVLALVAGVQTGELDKDDPALAEALFGVCGYYWASLAEIDTAAIARELTAPMLILQGSADFQVYPDRDYAAWQTILEGKENVSFRLFEGLNHLFMPSNGAMDITEYDQESHVSEEAIQAIAEWIGEQ